MRRLIILTLVLIPALLLSPASVQADNFNEVFLRVELQSDYLQAVYPDAPHEWCVAVSAVNYVSNYISPRLYAYWTNRGVVIIDDNTALEYGAGICGTQTHLFLTIMQSKNVTFRNVQCFFNDDQNNNHIFAEVWYNEKWNAFDCTMGAYWVSDNSSIWQTMSFDEVRNLPNHLDNVIFNQTNIFYLGYAGAGVDVFSHITTPTVEVVYGVTNSFDTPFRIQPAPPVASVPVAWIPSPESNSDSGGLNFGGLVTDPNGLVYYDKEICSMQGDFIVRINSGTTALQDNGQPVRIIRINEIPGPVGSIIAYEVTPIESAVTATISFIANQDDVQIASWDGACWQTENSTIKNGMISCDVDNLTSFALMEIADAPVALEISVIAYPFLQLIVGVPNATISCKNPPPCFIALNGYFIIFTF